MVPDGLAAAQPSGDVATPRSRAAVVHPAWLRISHWLNALAVIVLITSGWRIYNASPIFAFRFPKAMVLGGWLGGALLWHFAAMWLLVGNATCYFVGNLFSGRWKRRFLPLSPRQVLADLGAALRGRLGHSDLRQYNAVQKAAYLAAWALVVLVVVSGLAVWKPVQLPLLRELMGGFDNARIVHFVAMSGLVAFVAIHVLMVIVVPKTLRLMIFGR